MAELPTGLDTIVVTGPRGASFIPGEGAPQLSVGRTGDTYLDTTSLAIYLRDDAGWEPFLTSGPLPQVGDQLQQISMLEASATSSKNAAAASATSAVTAASQGLASKNATAISETNAGMSATNASNNAMAAAASATSAAASDYNASFTPITITADYAVSTGDRGRIVVNSAAALVTVTLSSGIPVGWVSEFVHTAAGGDISFVPAAGVTLARPAKLGVRTGRRYRIVRIRCVATNVFWLSADDEDAVPTISFTGSGLDGSTYTVAGGPPNGTTQWYYASSGLPIPSATASTFVMTAAAVVGGVYADVGGNVSNTVRFFTYADVPSLVAWFDPMLNANFQFGTGAKIAGQTSRAGLVATTAANATAAEQPMLDATALGGAPGIVWDGSLRQGLYAPVAAGSFPTALFHLAILKKTGTAQSQEGYMHRTNGPASPLITLRQTRYFGDGTTQNVRSGYTDIGTMTTLGMLMTGVNAASGVEYLNGTQTINGLGPSGAYGDTSTMLARGERIDKLSAVAFTGVSGDDAWFNIIPSQSQRDACVAFGFWRIGQQALIPLTNPYSGAPLRLQ